jgi:hypothetical protein
MSERHVAVTSEVQDALRRVGLTPQDLAAYNERKAAEEADERIGGIEVTLPSGQTYFLTRGQRGIARSVGMTEEQMAEGLLETYGAPEG